MVKWRQIPPEQSERSWDRALEGFPEQTIFQSMEWGRYKAAAGWTPQYWLAEEAAGKPEAMALVLVRRFPLNTTVAWCRGGPLGQPRYWNEDFLKMLRASVGGGRFYIRISSNRINNADDFSQLEKMGWKRPSYSLSTGKSLLLDLSGSEEEMSQNLTVNWRHNLRRAQNRKLKIEAWNNPSGSEMRELYTSMENFKDLSEQHSREDLEALIRHLKGRLLLYRCINPEGRTIALRACATQGITAWDLLAATSPEGRKCYAAYFLFWTLMLRCREKGIKTYELGGVDPEKNKGVYDFKKGTGGRDVEFMGEWDWAPSGILRAGVNLAIRYRGGGA